MFIITRGYRLSKTINNAVFFPIYISIYTSTYGEGEKEACYSSACELSLKMGTNLS